MQFSLIEIWHGMGIMAKVVAITLVLMALATVTVSIERLIHLARVSRSSSRFASRASPLLEAGELDLVIEQARACAPCPITRLVVAGGDKYQSHDPDRSGLSPIEAARREMHRRAEAISSELRAGLGVLASVGSVAPFVGLFGTVLGIISTFQGIKATGSGGLGAVSAGIAEALVVTALGLCVAIPAVLLFNYLTARIDRLELGLSHGASEFLDELERLHGHRSRPSHTAERAIAAAE